jgi:hypothetical protein
LTLATRYLCIGAFCPESVLRVLFAKNHPKVGLDNPFSALRIGIIFFYMPICKHTRTEILARRDGVDYVRCLDCDQVFEAEDLVETVPVYDDDDQPA